jgi:8-oxo-dGTP pyrophosphatase MutT (NUDIX family)
MVKFLQRNKFKDSYSVVFLLDSVKPNNVVLLKRAEWKKFAPNQFTGIGGHFELDEKAQDCAARELEEETGIKNIKLNRFAQAVIGDRTLIDYFWGLFTDKLPECNEGSLEWVGLTKIFDKPIIESTALVLKQWSKINFDLIAKWTVFEIPTKPDNDEGSGRKVDRIEEGIAID